MSGKTLAALAILVAGIVAAVPITIGGSATFGLMRAFAQQGPVCQPMPEGSSAQLPWQAGQPRPRECAQWRCSQRGKCQVLKQGPRRPITTCPPACTPGETEYVTPLEWMWTEGCSKWHCEAVRMPDCQPGYIRNAGGRCVANMIRRPDCQPGYIRNAGGSCVANEQRRLVR